MGIENRAADNRVIGLIPARAGSKGVTKKNLRLVGSQTLLERAVASALRSNSLDQLWVSSDSSEILEIATARGAFSHLRSSESSSDDATAAQVIEEFIAHSRADRKDVIVYLQPTSPFRTSNRIEESVQLFFDQGQHPVVSVTPMKQHPAKALRLLSNGRVEPAALDGHAPGANRQFLPEYLYPNGAIYIFTVADFFASKDVPLSGAVPYFMSQLESTDVDTETDLFISERLSNEF